MRTEDMVLERPSLRLKADTRSAHDDVEKVPFATRLAAGNVSRGAYARQLVAYGRLHEALESRTDGKLPVVARSAWAFEDAAELGHAYRRLEGPTEHAVAELEARIADEACFARLCGYAYVLEGSALGSAFMAPKLVASLDLRPDQVRYYRGLGPCTMQAWQEMRAALDRALSEPAAYASALDGALAFFRQMGVVLGSLDERCRTVRPSSAARAVDDAQREHVGRHVLA